MLRGSRIISSSSAWMVASGHAVAAAALDRKLRPTASLGYGLGDLAEVGLTLQSQWRECAECEGDDRPVQRNLAMAYFKLGLPEGFAGTALPALALTFSKTLPERAQLLADVGEEDDRASSATKAASLTLMASKEIGAIALHAGGEILVARHARSGAELEPTLRPVVGFQWLPKQYPLTTLLADLRWIPSTNTVDGESITEWQAGWGVRYQALSWAAVELSVRHQQGEGAKDAQVSLGLRGELFGRKGEQQR
jgi:hypothetical protein